MRLILVLAVAMLLISSGCIRQIAKNEGSDQIVNVTKNETAATPPKSGTYYMEFEGMNRAYLIHFPKGYDAKNSYPLVLVLHGARGNGENMMDTSQMSEKADKEGFIVIYPDGTGRLPNVFTWNAGNCCEYALENDVNDAGFLDALIGKLESSYSIDKDRVYAAGFSNGAMMSYVLACTSDKIAAIAPVSGALNYPCNPSHPVSVIIFHGTSDRHVLYEGGVPEVQVYYQERTDSSVDYAVDFWTNKNGCSKSPETEISGNITRYTYGGCSAGVEVYKIEGGGHAWPGSDGNRIGVGDVPTKEIDATDIMWEFFKAHPK